VVAFFDVDHLKVINDSRGHVAGDRMLQQVVDAIRGAVRSFDLVIAYGGDEFVCAFLGSQWPR
jgi:diguanylate cyclase (GGDEF)-like protein